MAKNGDIIYKGSTPFAQWIKNNVSTVTSGTGLYHHTSSLEKSAADNNYRYAGLNPNNWIKFNNEDYRIIGIFGDNVKIVKKDNLGKIAWDSTNSNNWDRPATLNTYLNTTWYNSLGNDKNLIADMNWAIGGLESRNNASKQSYDSEQSQFTTNTYKIGLMSCSDYGFAATPWLWGRALNKLGDNTYNYSWMYMYDGNYYWTIDKSIGDNEHIWIINSGGYFEVYSANDKYVNVVYPSFYLKPDVGYLGGDGSQGNPFIIG